ncbi:MAG: hypothetical protein ACC742_08750 [Thermoanaerobaculales bacterium]
MSCFPPIAAIWLAFAIVAPPFADAQTRHWTPAGYGGSGLFPVVAVDPTPGTDVVYLGSDVAGVYKSTDGGDTWRAGNSGLVSLQIASLEIDPSDPRRLWVGTPLGLHLSEDGGQSWTLVDGSINSFKHVDNRGIAISPDGQTLLVTHHDLAGEPEDGVYSGTLHRSTDAGFTWQAVLSFSDVAISAVVIDRRQPTNAYIVVADRGVQRSTDGGATWHDFSNGLPGGRTWKQLDVGQDVLYVTAEPLSGSTGVGVFKSAKSNASWASALNGLDTGEETGGEPLGDPIRISPDDDDTVYLGQDAWPFNFFRTTDGGSTWVGTPLDTNYVFDTVNNPQQTWVDQFLAAFDIAVDPNRPNRIFYTTWGGVLRSDDGGQTFTEKIVGAQNVCSTDIMAINGALLETNMDGGVYRSTDGGATWTSRYPTESLPLNFWLHAWNLEEASGGTLYFAAGTTNGATIYRSTDGGLSWQKTADGLPQIGDPAVDIFSEVALASHPTQPGTLFAAVDYFGVYVTTNSGQSWQEIINLHGTNGPDEPVVKCLEVDPTKPDRIFMGQYWNGLWYSENGGQSWFEAEVEGAEVQSVQEIVALADGRVFAALADGVYLSRDGGHTFTRSFPAAPNLGEDELEYVEAIAVNPSDPNDISVVTAKRYPVWYNRGSVWRTTDGAVTWSEITGDLPILRVRNVTYDDDGGLWVSTWCGGTYRTDLAATCTEPSIDQQPHGSTVAAGATATVSVSATGTAPLSHQWYRGASGNTVDPISGATETSYTTGPLTETTKFWVRITNDCGSVDSATATINVGSTAPRPRLPSGRAVPNRP